ncbi:MAG: hypothetical protein AAF355_04035 [Myxococcota bacterium]
MNRSLIQFAFMGAVSFSLVEPAQAQTAQDVARARARLSHEPTVSEATNEALRYFRVHPGALDSMRRRARARGSVPILSVGYRFDDHDYERFEVQEITDPRRNEESTGSHTRSFSAGGIWDFREFMFHPSEVQVYGVVGIQRDVMLEVTRTYFLRRQLQLRLLLRPPEDPLARAALELRVDEFSAVLDVVTGGWFSSESERRRWGTGEEPREATGQGTE